MPTLRALTLSCLLGALLAGTAGCTDEPRLVGQMGITADAQGRPVLVLATCRGSIDDVSLSLLPVGKQTASGDVGEWTRASRVRGTSRLDTADPAAPWQGPGVVVHPRRYYIAEASSSSNEVDALNDMTFRGRQVRKLDPSKVYLNSDDPDSDELVAHPSASFQHWACAPERD